MDARERHSEKRSVWSILATVFMTAAPINFVWELLQSPLYICSDDSSLMWRHSFLASLGDGLLVMLIFAIGGIMLGRRDWFENPGIRGYALMAIAGFIIAVVVEWIARHTLMLWDYSSSMPIVPGIDVGITAIAQMLLLPPLIFRASALQLRRFTLKTPLKQ